MNIGIFEVPEQLDFPRTHKELRRQLRAVAQSMDLDLRFVARERDTYSYCDPINARAIVIAEYKGRRFPRVETAHYALHELAHWMDYNNGLFRDYYVRRGYKHVINPKLKDILRLGLRAERHCERLAHVMLWVMYSKVFHGESDYDDNARGRGVLMEYYGIED